MSTVLAWTLVVLLSLNALLLTWLIFKRTEDNREEKSAVTREEGALRTSAQEIEELNVKLIRSQIGPHFIFNSLNAIYYLCEKDTEAAQAAINEFSAYLRGNIDSFGKSEPIPFHEEMEHIRHYLTLEKLRFEDTLTIIYDIHSEDFMLPALSAQALVENAVRHGISKNENGGAVELHVWQGKDTSCVEIRDNGRGFDPEHIPEDGRTHTGIENVRKLLKVMCGGSLEIISAKGKGTSAMIRIPRHEDEI